ncbi:MAG TPA: PQQ-binding-like beta-propeller repeat protein [Bryobacteraceae bacterium]|nr:PQQ-binding-like beta-propeller repeat protein [Bryobacteraceae bacterium]
MKTSIFFIAMAAGVAGNLPEWPQFGGPDRNFMVDSKGLADAWPAGGPKKLWMRPLGEGYSEISVDQGALYTMYRKGEQEVAIAMDAATGKTRWEYAYNASFGNMAMENGPGPHTTPLILGNRVYTVGILAILNCFDKTTGKLVWSKDLYRDFPGASRMDRGYSSSPLAYKNSIILTIGGAGHAVIALNPADGHLLWGKNDFGNSPSSPTLIHVAGQDQLVAFLDDGGSAAHGLIAGLDPNNGALLWTHPHKTSWGLNIALPVWGDDGILVMSSAYGTGARALKLTREGGKTTVKELWANNRMRVHHTTMVRVGEVIYGSSGDFGPAPLTAIDVGTGEIKWQERAFPKASFVYADGKFFVVDEDGGVSLATFSPAGAKVISKFSLLEHNAWTAPTLVGTKLYVRDRKSIAALEVGR